MPDSFVADAQVKDSFTPDAPTAPSVDPARAELEHKARGGFLLNPQGITERAAQATVLAPVIGAGGAGLGALASKLLPGAAKVAPMVGRALTAGALGGGEAAARGESPGWAALLDTAVAGLTEGAVSKVSSGFKLPLLPKFTGLEERGAPKRAFEWATKAAKDALDPIRARLPKAARLNVPSISKQPVTVDDAVKKLSALEGDAYKQTRSEIISEMNRLDIQKTIATPSGAFVRGPRPYAGTVYQRGTSDMRFAPPTGATVAETARPYLTGPEARSVADALTTQDVGGMPFGAVAGLVAGEQMGEGAGHLLGHIRVAP